MSIFSGFVIEYVFLFLGQNLATFCQNKNNGLFPKRPLFIKYTLSVTSMVTVAT